MKKILIAAIVLFAASGAFAGGMITLNGGINSSNMGSDDTKDVLYLPVLGYNAGLGFEYSITEQLGVRLETSYETRGEAEGHEVGSADSAVTYNFKYIQMPLLVSFSLPVGKAKISFFGGPEFGILRESKVTVEQTYVWEGVRLNNCKSNICFDSTAEVIDNKGSGVSLLGITLADDAGITLGIGFELPVPFGSVFFRPSYYLGMMNVNSRGLQNRNLKVQFGYGIGIF